MKRSTIDRQILEWEREGWRIVEVVTPEPMRRQRSLFVRLERLEGVTS